MRKRVRSCRKCAGRRQETLEGGGMSHDPVEHAGLRFNDLENTGRCRECHGTLGGAIASRNAWERVTRMHCQLAIWLECGQVG